MQDYLGLVYLIMALVPLDMAWLASDLGSSRHMVVWISWHVMVKCLL